VELVVVVVTVNDAVSSGVSLRDDWLALTTGGVVEDVTSVVMMLTSPLRRLILVNVTEMVPVWPRVIVRGEFDEREKSPFDPRPR
jgi:hypothetical protein